jgi:hypothetical protein
MDNELSFWGSLRHPGAIGKVIRLCLSLGVTPVFIPVREPWRNGIIEHFNDTMQRYLLKRERYNNLIELKLSAEEFANVHNEHHHYSSQKGLTPNKALKRLNYPYTLLKDDYDLSKIYNYPLKGEVFIIRFIRSDLKFNFFGKIYILPDRARYKYVLGILTTHQNKIMIFNDQEYLTEFQFIIQ